MVVVVVDSQTKRCDVLTYSGGNTGFCLFPKDLNFLKNVFFFFKTPTTKKPFHTLTMFLFREVRPTASFKRMLKRSM